LEVRPHLPEANATHVSAHKTYFAAHILQPYIRSL